MSKFDHLKNKSKSKPSFDDFIEGANKELIPAKNKKNRKILLSITGRNRRADCLKAPQLIYLKKNVADDIEKYCNGSAQVVLNYLILRGLEEIKKAGEIIVISADEI
jgi:hypothetical protein